MVLKFFGRREEPTPEPSVRGAAAFAGLLALVEADGGRVEFTSIWFAHGRKPVVHIIRRWPSLTKYYVDLIRAHYSLPKAMTLTPLYEARVPKVEAPAPVVVAPEVAPTPKFYKVGDDTLDAIVNAVFKRIMLRLGITE